MPTKPVPTALKILRGNPGNRPLNKNEPQPSKDIPPPPSFLDKIAKREYRRIVKILEPLGVITVLDVTALTAYAEAYSIWVAAVKEIKINGLMAESKLNGHLYQNPYVGMANKAMDRMMKMAIEFGMTPSSRTKIIATNPTGGDSKKDNGYEQWRKSGGKKKTAKA